MAASRTRNKKTSSFKTMKLNIVKGKVMGAEKICIYGPEGVGKSTLASHFPAPLFLDTEGGTGKLNVARVEIGSYNDLKAAVAELVKGNHEYRSVVIDTVDWADKMIADWICEKHKKAGIEEFGYGKGYTYLGEEFNAFLLSLDALIAKGINVVLLAHSTVSKFVDPQLEEGYDRYSLKLSKQSGPLVKEWVDALLFINFFTVLKGGKGEQKKAAGGKERVLYAERTAAYDAKNRHGLPESMDADFAAIAHLFEATVAAPKQEPKKEEAPAPVEQPLDEPAVPTITADDVADIIEPMADLATAAAIENKWLKAGQTWRDLPQNILTSIKNNPEGFRKFVNKS